MQYLGDFNCGNIVYVPFHTFSSDDPSASCTITGLAVGDIEVYKLPSMTQRASDTGYALLDTDGIDIDGITGIHGVYIDTSNDTDTGFWAAGNEYLVVISTITVDGATISFGVFFGLENRKHAGEMIATTIASLSSQTSFTLTRGSANDNAYNGCTIIVTDKASQYGVQKCVGYISDYTGSTKTVTLIADPGIFTMAVGDNVSILATAVNANVRAISDDETAADNLESILDGNGVTNDVDITMRSLTVTNDAGVGVNVTGTTAGVAATGTAGDGIAADSSGSNGNGISAQGNGTGHGVIGTGGATSGSGITGVGGASSGAGIYGYASGGDNAGIIGTGYGSGSGLAGVGGATGPGISGQGGATSGPGIKGSAQNNDDAGMELVKNGAGKDIDADEIDNILSDTNELQGDWTDTGRLDALIDAIKAVTDNLPDSGALTNIDTGINNLETNVPDIISLANINAEVDTALSDYDALVPADLPTNFGDLSITATTGRVDVASIEGSDATDQIRDSVVDDATRIDASAINAITADWTDAGRLDALLDAIKAVTDNMASAATTLVSGTVSHDNTAATTTVFYSDDITEDTADHYNGRIVIFTSGILQNQASDITDYELVAGEGKFTVTALTEAPPDNCTFVIV